MDPENDCAWRNLGWAAWLHTKDYAEAARCYKKAIELNPDSALYLEECDQALEALGAPVQERYDLLKSHHATAIKRYYPEAQEVITGTYVGDYDYVLDMLDNCYFPTREGVADFHNVFIDALLLAGKKKISEGDTDAAIALYMKSFTYPENHQVFRVDKRTTHDAQSFYYLGQVYELRGDKETAKEWYQKAADQDFEVKGSKNYRYWTGLALKKLGRKAEAKAIFRKMVQEGKGRIVTDYVNFYGAEGSSGHTVDDINAGAYYTKALGELGLGRKCAARRDLKRVLKLKPADLWAAKLLETNE